MYLRNTSTNEITCSVLPSPIACANTHPWPGEFFALSIDSITLSNRNLNFYLSKISSNQKLPDAANLMRFYDSFNLSGEVNVEPAIFVMPDIDYFQNLKQKLNFKK